MIDKLCILNSNLVCQQCWWTPNTAELAGDDDPKFLVIVTQVNQAFLWVGTVWPLERIKHIVVSGILNLIAQIPHYFTSLRAYKRAILSTLSESSVLIIIALVKLLNLFAVYLSGLWPLKLGTYLTKYSVSNELFFLRELPKDFKPLSSKLWARSNQR